MESFFKNFDVVLNLMSPAVSSSRTLNFRYRNARETAVAGALFLIALACLLRYALGNSQWLALVLLLALVIVVVVYIRDVDSLSLDANGNLTVAKGMMGFKTRILIPKADIQFIGVGVGEKFPATGKPHLVYIRHNA